ncbi:PLP-dependent transferase [Gonapodya prolifera JEL478]|uniref:PLP-dependent transferase n=1 Tax=Gonapodya prolifera (strain JEL478) TaxID=1344416 RepID=A0A139AET2_GONPJ|nr:PLP-dependent transferase [Gonapodya prolifera JEL478]|eukprot:KXS15260.1 PLP-dependent transferase [Gonapodya prolifera JEL478]
MSQSSPQPVFGRPLLHKDFPHLRSDNGFAHLNNGSFGSSPLSVVEYADQLRREWYSNPDEFWYERTQPLLVESRNAVAKLIRAPSDAVAFIDNATTGAAIVAHRVMWDFVEGKCQKGDLVIHQSSTYASVKYALDAHCTRAGATSVSIPLPFPAVSPSETVATWSLHLRATIRAHPGRGVRLVVLDHIASENGVKYDVGALARETRRVCEEEGVGERMEVFVDGAHGPGQAEVDVGKWDVDYYTGNMHQWCFTPTSCAVFYARPTPSSPHLPAPLKSLTHPITSHNSKLGFVEECAMQATRDYSAWFAVTRAIAYLDSLGGPARVAKYLNETVWEGANLCAKRWGTRVGMPREAAAGMVMVELPREILEGLLDKATVVYGQGGGPLRALLRREYGVETQTPYVRVEGDIIDGSTVEKRVAWLRLAAPVWVGKDSFERVAVAVEDIVKRLRKGETFAKYYTVSHL